MFWQAPGWLRAVRSDCDFRFRLTSVSLGLLASASPCILPLYPGYLAYLSGANEQTSVKGRYFLGFFVLAGVLSMMLVLGLIIALLSIPVGKALSIIIPIADLLIITLGILLLLKYQSFQNTTPGADPCSPKSVYKCIYVWFTLRSNCFAVFGSVAGWHLCHLAHCWRSAWQVDHLFVVWFGFRVAVAGVIPAIGSIAA